MCRRGLNPDRVGARFNFCANMLINEQIAVHGLYRNCQREACGCLWVVVCPAFVTTDCHSDHFRQFVALQITPIFLKRSCVPFRAGDLAPVAPAMQHPIWLLSLFSLLRQVTEGSALERVQGFSWSAGYPVKPDGEIPPSIATSPARFGGIRECHVKANHGFLSQSAEFLRNMECVNRSVPSFECLDSLSDARYTIFRI